MLKLLNLIPFTAFGTRLITTDSKDDLSKLSSSEILKVAHNTRKAIFVEANAKDDGGPTSNRFILAKRWKESGAPLTVEVVNSLVNSDNQITQSQFDYFAFFPGKTGTLTVLIMNSIFHFQVKTELNSTLY